LIFEVAPFRDEPKPVSAAAMSPHASLELTSHLSPNPG
jgi:hypothetical protein